MYVSDFYSVVSPSGETIFYAKLWILVYDSGNFISWNRHEVYENYQLMSEIGATGVYTYAWIFVSKNSLPDVYKSILHRQSEQTLHEESL